MAGGELFGKPHAVFPEDALIILLRHLIEKWIVMSGDKQLGTRLIS